MKKHEFNILAKTVWKHTPSETELNELNRALDSVADKESFLKEELRLNELLGKLPDVSVPSNFTARVVEAAATQPARRNKLITALTLSPLRRRRVTAFAAVIVAAIIGVTGWKAFEHMNRVETAQSAAVFTEIAIEPDFETISNFETIYDLSQAPEVDNELLTALSQTDTGYDSY
ncbi:MAG: hypothetical protein K9N48_05790 [Verrucomicrobia bacterium]|nr:hypothetical protein [Verrucomicrobiota bacterium]MCF7708895.1 hypothetical protein [Verrucomicrobiota bacterium]